MNALFLTAILSTPVAAYLTAKRLLKKPKIIIEDFEEEDMSEDQPGVQSELEVAAVEYVRNANQETLAKLRVAACNYVERECDVAVSKKAAKKTAKPKK